MRATGVAFVYKTGVIADLLMSAQGMELGDLAFFTRSCKFDKSLILDIAACMLAAGDLPKEKEWPGYEPIDAIALCEGLEGHKRYLPVSRRTTALAPLCRRSRPR